jgi:hypothetical protein
MVCLPEIAGLLFGGGDFLHGQGIYFSSFLYVLALKVCADPFSGVGGVCRQEIYLFQAAGYLRVLEYPADDFKILGMVGRYVHLAIVAQAADYLQDILYSEKSPFVMPGFWPGVGKVNMEGCDGLVPDETTDKITGIGTQELYIC